MFTYTAKLNQNLMDEFNIHSPYYTSYPSLGKWNSGVSETDYISALTNYVSDAEVQDTGLYVHFPFCPRQCYFCICNVSISNDSVRINKFFNSMLKEIDLLFGFFKKHGKKVRITDIHLGGGTPSYMTDEQLTTIVNKLFFWISKSQVEEFSMEFDPRSSTLEKFRLASSLGVNRISFGVQEFKKEIQEAVNRVHTYEYIDNLLTDEVRSMFKGINFDILYGLPMQTRESFRETIKLVKQLAPDRVTLLRYAHVPEIIKHMKILDKYAMPDDQEKALFFFDAIDSFRESGWEHIGIDHFAKKDDKLVKSRNEKDLKRTFIGFQSGKLTNLLGIGPSSTLKLENYYFQNTCNLEDYVTAVEMNKFPINVGYRLSDEDMLRRFVIERILCDGELVFADVESRYSINFRQIFGVELLELKKFEDLEIAKIDNNGIFLTDLGMAFKRQICKTFDKFLRIDQEYKIYGTGNKLSRLTL